MTATTAGRPWFYRTVALCVFLLTSKWASAQTPSPALLVLEKSDRSMAIVDPTSLKIVARVPVGEDPHEIVASPDGKVAYISNYGGADSTLNTISVADLVAQKPLAPILLGALRSPHGLAFAGGKLYFTVETNKAFGRYDPATQTIDWILGTGQDRTHMVNVSESLDRIVTSNVNSGTISIIEQVMPSFPPQYRPAAGGPPPGGPRKTWEVTSVPSGRGCEGFDVSPDGKEIWAANAQDGTVTIIDIASKKVIGTINVGTKRSNRIKFTPDGKRVLVSLLSGPDLVILDPATRKVVKRLPIGHGAAGILVQPDGARAYVACTPDNSIAVIDLHSFEVVGHIQAGGGPDGLAWAVRR